MEFSREFCEDFWKKFEGQNEEEEREWKKWENEESSSSGSEEEADEEVREGRLKWEDHQVVSKKEMRNIFGLLRFSPKEGQVYPHEGKSYVYDKKMDSEMLGSSSRTEKQK